MEISYQTPGEITGLDIEDISKEAAEELLQQANDGDINAMFEVSRMYFGGFQVEQDYEKASYWSRRAAEDGDERAMVNLAHNLEMGLGIKMDKKEARKWVLRAALKGDAVGQYNVGLYYSKGIGGKKDEKAATRYFRLSAKRGNAAGQTSYGMRLIENKGVSEQDVAGGLEWLYKAMRQHYDLAFFNLGSYALEGKYVEKDRALAYDYFVWAASIGNTEAKKIIDEWDAKEVAVV